MDNQPQQPIIIHSQYIKDLSMEIPHAPVIFKKLQDINPKVGVEVDVKTQKLEDNKVFNVLLNIRINGDLEDEKAFILELSYGAVVSLNVPEEHEKAVLRIEIPHLIYPYARQIVSTTMSEAGLPPILLDPIDFPSMFNSRSSMFLADDD